METASTDSSTELSGTFYCVAICGCVFALVAFATHGFGALTSASVGVGLALANLWGLSRLVRVYMYSSGPAWALVGVLKMVALFGAVFLLISRGLVDVGALVVGYGALPAGILATRLKPTPAPAAEER